ncbi:hypothetical protein WMY93_014594 [Mugilogobius chulae]|uniref:Poly [ADP-ribose] polymerase n=1 Tax=Mugilogobius chulae TaxID=88201 RepID=A0AAW0P1K5_9GOBI
MDPDKYPLYFVAEEDFDTQERKKIRRYFTIRRDSGGGDCGELQKVGEKLYKICFEQEEVQERVLGRKTHTISLPSGHLQLTVSRTEPEARNVQISSTETSAKPPNVSNCLERTLQPDTFLIRYLNDCSKALKILQKQFACIGCSAELNLDKEVVTVKADAQKGLGAFSGISEKWEIQVDRVWSSFQESFTCYHVVDPKIFRPILQDKSFTDDDVEVYSELGYIVVVGETSTVNDKIQNVQRNLPKKTELAIDERQFNLIEEEFARVMRTKLPNVNLIKCHNYIVLEGLDTEVQSGLAAYDRLVKKIQQKIVHFSPELQNFFVTSDAITKYKTRIEQCLSNPVSLEIFNSDLVLSSLSIEAVDEAVTILQRDFTTAFVNLEGNAAVPPDLDRIKELIMKEKIYVNVQERRLDVQLVSGPQSTIKVQIAGYSDSVNRLREELLNYLLIYVTVEDRVSLPSAEMVENFDKLLTIFAPKDSRVSMNTSLVPRPCVLLSGPMQLVRKTQSELSKELSSLISETLILNGPGARQYFKAVGKASKELIERSNQVFIQEMENTEEVETEEEPEQVIYSAPTSLPATSLTEEVSRRSSIYRRTPARNISISIKLGCLVNEQVNVQVVPMLKKHLQSTRIGKSLVRKGGLSMKIKFSSAMKKSLAPGGVLEVIAPPSVGCSKLFFIECLPWDGLGGQSMKALSSGLQRCLELCEEQGYSSVALPVIGPGKVLQYPLKEAVLLLTEKLKQFGRTAKATSTLQDIHIVIKPDEDSTEEIFLEVHRQLTQNINQEGQVIFKPISSELDNVCITVGSGIQLELVFGDITNERTDAVVNSTNFENLNSGVCKEILAVAGPDVAAELRSAKLERDEVFVTQPGRFPCQGLLHVYGKSNAHLLQQLMGSIVQYCEAYEWMSVAMPAICAGAAGLSAGAVAGAMLRGLNEALSIPLFSLVKVRIVLNKINIFTAFKEEATQLFSASVIKKVAPSLPSFTRPSVVSAPPPPPASASVLPPAAFSDLPRPRTSSSDQKSIFKITGLSKNNISKAMTTMREVYQAQSSSQTFKKGELAALTPGDLATLKTQVEALGLQVECNEGDWTVSGLTVKVNQVIHLLKSFIYGTLTREKRTREEEESYRKVAWCIRGPNGDWERLPKKANYQLEQGEIDEGIKDAQGVKWIVDLPNMEVTNNSSTTKALKRLENLPDFTFPLYWDNMTSGENLKVVPLLPSCAEYQEVKDEFQQTCQNTVLKIERVQNIHLRRSYEVQLKHIADKNRLVGGENEELLFHGTTKENAKSIMSTGFNRRFSGQNATAYGQGTYFALDARYSAQPTYSKPAADGTQLMFLARVLTGLYTLGHKDMRVPPPRDPLNPHERYDSVVDNMDQPNMFIVFHDNQAYPDYLITFK